MHDESTSEVEIEEYETVSFTIVYDDLTSIIKGIKLPLDLKIQIQKESTQNKNEPKRVRSQSSKMIDILEQGVTRYDKAGSGGRYDISKALHYVKIGTNDNACSDL